MLSDPSGGGREGPHVHQHWCCTDTRGESGQREVTRAPSENGNLAYFFGGLFNLRGPQSPVPRGAPEPTSVSAGAASLGLGSYVTVCVFVRAHFQESLCWNNK